MRRYRLTKFLTPFGLKPIVELGGAYGECIVYENKLPKDHISCFDDKWESNKLIHDLIANKVESWDSIIQKINKNRKLKLTVEGYPSLIIEWSSKLVELDLQPLPLEWVKEIAP